MKPRSSISTIPAGYFFARALARIAFTLFFRNVRLLRAENISDAGPVILAVSHPGSFLDSVLLIAAFDRPLRCVLDSSEMGGPLRTFAARLFRMIPRAEGDEGFSAVRAASIEALERGETVALFADFPSSELNGAGRHFRSASRLALEAEAQLAGPLEVYPVDLLLPVGRAQTGELAIYVDAPLVPREYLARFEGDESQAEHALALELDPSGQIRANAFALSPERLEFFYSDLEQALRAELAGRWAAKKNWKQNPEEFRLSGFVRDWSETMNALNPGRLLALGEWLSAWRERHRRCSLGEMLVGEASVWIRSAGARALVWAEVLLGFAPALCGAINHLPAAIALRLAGLHRHRPGRERTLEWILRSLVVAAFYAVQIFLCDRWLGRAAAGYYALALPASGLYLARYAWLLHRRARRLWMRARSQARAGRARRLREELLARLRSELDAYAKAERSPAQS